MGWVGVEGKYIFVTSQFCSCLSHIVQQIYLSSHELNILMSPSMFVRETGLDVMKPSGLENVQNKRKVFKDNHWRPNLREQESSEKVRSTAFFSSCSGSLYCVCQRHLSRRNFFMSFSWHHAHITHRVQKLTVILHRGNNRPFQFEKWAERTIFARKMFLEFPNVDINERWCCIQDTMTAYYRRLLNTLPAR